MRLNPFDTGNINVRSSGGGGFPGGGAGGLGCGTIIIAALGYFLFGLDPMQTASTVSSVQQGQQQSAPGSTDEQAICTSGPYATEACNALQSLNQTWAKTFQDQNFGERFQQPTLDLYSGSVRTGCGSGSSSMGPFYCPNDKTIYLDTSFYQELERMAGSGGDFARYYVIAHEYGHHIQNLTGVLGQVQSAQSQNPRAANQLQVLVELQADCYAGVWASNAVATGFLLEVSDDDLAVGLDTAAAVGDDRIQQGTQGRTDPESFTHGTSAQRQEWFMTGYRSGDPARCDTFSGGI